MKHRKCLFLSIWGVAIAIILWISGEIIGGLGIIFRNGVWGTSPSLETKMALDGGVALVWVGITLFVLGIFGIVTTILKEILDKEGKSTLPNPPKT
jgi:hypothetical protein